MTGIIYYLLVPI